MIKTLLLMAALLVPFAGGDAYRHPVEPGLTVGDRIPDAACRAEVMAVTGERFPFDELVGERYMLVVFYRGDWCRFSRRVLQAWQPFWERLDEMGVSFMAISYQTPEGMTRTLEELNLEFPLLCDPTGDLCRAFKLEAPIAAHIQESMKRGRELDLSEEHEHGRWALPAMSTFIIDPEGLVRAARSSWTPSALTPPNQAMGVLQELMDWDADHADYQTPDRPGLAVGDHAPRANLVAADGSIVPLVSLYQDKPLIVTFYRGMWCPYCTNALGEWRNLSDDIERAGARFIAISPQGPAVAEAAAETYENTFGIYSDLNGNISKAFRLQFDLDEATREKYGKYGIDLAKENANGSWSLPAPATFVIDTDGTIAWVFADWDYAKRADPAEVIAAVRALEPKPRRRIDRPE